MDLKKPRIFALWSLTFVILVGFILSIVKPWQNNKDDKTLSPRTESLREIRNTKSIHDHVETMVDTLMDKTDKLEDDQDNSNDDEKSQRKMRKQEKKKQQRRRKSKKNENSVDLEGQKIANRLEKKRQKKKERMLRDQEEYRRWKKRQLKTEQSTQDPVEQLWEELFRKNLDFKSVFGETQTGAGAH